MTKVEVTREALEAVAEQVISVVLAKNQDYGDAWQHHGEIGVLLRLYDKGMRYTQLTDNVHVMVADESLTDTVRDLVGYGFLFLLMRAGVLD